MLKFYEKKYIFFMISALIMIIGTAALFINGLTLDITFKGGAIIKYNYEKKLNISAVEQLVSDTLSRSVTVQSTHDIAQDTNKLSLSLAGNSSFGVNEQENLDMALKQKFPDNHLVLSESNNVEPFIGKRFLRNGITAIALSSVLIILYVWLRFKKISGLSAGVMALIALLHDCLMVFFTFVIFKLPLNESFIAVILTIIGYSINDTIVIYDRIRENSCEREKLNIITLVNKSITQSLTRSFNTMLTTIISILIMLFFASYHGIDSIILFALPMAVGMFSGCYSSVCIAGPLWVLWQKHKGVK